MKKSGGGVGGVVDPASAPTSASAAEESKGGHGLKPVKKAAAQKKSIEERLGEIE